MTFIDIVTAMVILGLFFSGFSQVFLPVYQAWDSAAVDYRTGQTIHFIAESFERECGKLDRNIESWRKAATAAKELESYEITELWQGDVLRALKLKCTISGEYLEIIGVCAS